MPTCASTSSHRSACATPVYLIEPTMHKARLAQRPSPRERHACGDRWSASRRSTCLTSSRAAAACTGPGSDYLKFLRALMNGGRLDGAQILRPETVALMGQNHDRRVDGAGVLKAANPHMTNDARRFSRACARAGGWAS